MYRNKPIIKFFNIATAEDKKSMKNNGDSSSQNNLIKITSMKVISKECLPLPKDFDPKLVHLESDCPDSSSVRGYNYDQSHKYLKKIFSYPEAFYNIFLITKPKRN